VQAQAAYVRRQEALEGAARRLEGSAQVPEKERTAVLEAIDAAHEERADGLGDPARR
jgi:hypothetical protein